MTTSGRSTSKQLQQQQEPQSSSSSSSSHEPQSKSYFALVGDSAHVATLVSVASFSYLVVTTVSTTTKTKPTTSSDSTSIFDESWRRDGFCVSNSQLLYWNSHDVCLYFDVAAGLCLATLYYWMTQLAQRRQKSPSNDNNGMDGPNEVLLSNCVGIVAHGVAHGAIAVRMRAGTITPETMAMTPYEKLLEMTTFRDRALDVLPDAVFWIALLKAGSPNLKNYQVLAMAAACLYANTVYVPRLFGFTFVQLALMVAFAINQLMRPIEQKKTWHYASYPVMVGFPLTVVGWIESTQCDKFVKDRLYGHLVYDAYIPLSIATWYASCYYYYSYYYCNVRASTKDAPAAAAATSSQKVKTT